MIANLRRSAAPLITTIQRLFSEDLAKENDFLHQENKILRSKLGRRVPLTEANRRTLVRYGPVLSKQLVPAEFLRGASRRGTSLAWEANAYITGSANEGQMTDGDSLLSFTRHKRLPVIAVASRK